MTDGSIGVRHHVADARLDAIDARLDALPGGARTLAPGRARATPLAALVDSLAGPDAARRDALSLALGRVVSAEIENFPENLFWDSDALAASLAQAPDAHALDDSVHTIESLMAIYGVHGPVCFQYVHDFVYGMDWATWVARKRLERAAVAPFGIDFLRYSQRRGRELLARIAAGDDPRYQPIAAGQRRNVFAYSRVPDDELRLMRALAQRSAIPVVAWEFDVVGDASRDIQALREAVASELGLGVSAS